MQTHNQGSVSSARSAIQHIYDIKFGMFKCARMKFYCAKCLKAVFF